MGVYIEKWVEMKVSDKIRQKKSKENFIFFFLFVHFFCLFFGKEHKCILLKFDYCTSTELIKSHKLG